MTGTDFAKYCKLAPDRINVIRDTSTIINNIGNQDGGKKPQTVE